jgi:hypothetical protein
MVQVVKEALRKYCLTFNKQHWCRFLWSIAMGYRMSRQRSLGGHLPYFLLFGRWPIVGASVRDVLQKVVELDNPAEWARLINERAKVSKKHMPIAFNNLAVAQHRDMLRYTKTSLRGVRAEVAAVRSRGLCMSEVAEGGFSGPEGWSTSFESQVGRQWGPLGPGGA